MMRARRRPTAARTIATIIGLYALAAMPVAAQANPRASAAPSDTAALRLIERAAAAYRSARTLRATFVQTLTNPRTSDTYTSRGEFLQRGERQFAFIFSDPPEDRIVTDGEVLWLYLPSSAKGQALKVPRAVGGGLDLAASVLHDPARRYRVEAAGDTTLFGRAVRVVRLTPRAADVPFTGATLWLDPADALIRRAEFTEPGGMRRVIEFPQARVGATIADDAFTFTPPPGVRVIDQAALLGGSTPRKP